MITSYLSHNLWVMTSIATLNMASDYACTDRDPVQALAMFLKKLSIIIWWTIFYVCGFVNLTLLDLSTHQSHWILNLFHALYISFSLSLSLFLCLPFSLSVSTSLPSSLCVLWTCFERMQTREGGGGRGKAALRGPASPGAAPGGSSQGSQVLSVQTTCPSHHVGSFSWRFCDWNLYKS